MNYKTQLFKITTQTNMHVGSGDQNYGIIDKLVQRDVVTNLPIINASSLKGALREYFVWKNGADTPMVNYVFGKENKGDKIADNAAGNYRFFDAHLLSIPLRSNTRPFFRASSPTILNSFMEFSKLFKHDAQLTTTVLEDKDAFHFLDSESNVILEDFDITASKHAGANHDTLKKMLGDDGVVISDDYFNRVSDDNHLPVVPRNSLENGQSKNLWYEQIIPRQSSFYFWVMAPDTSNNHFETFRSELIGENNLFQIGANASIGYGFSKIDLMESAVPANA